MDPLVARAGKITVRQEVRFQRVGHVTAAATEEHVETAGGRRTSAPNNHIQLF